MTISVGLRPSRSSSGVPQTVNFTPGCDCRNSTIEDRIAAKPSPSERLVNAKRKIGLLAIADFRRVQGLQHQGLFEFQTIKANRSQFALPLRIIIVQQRGAMSVKFNRSFGISSMKMSVHENENDPEDQISKKIGIENQSPRFPKTIASKF